MRTVILGCGYVGLALGRRLRAAGHEVVGVRRSESGLRDVTEAGLTAVRADVTDADSLAAVPDADAVVYAASAGGRSVEAARDVYVEGLRTAIDAFAARVDPPERLVYTSSTGVYGDHGGAWVDETTPIEPTTDRQRVLADAETVALEHSAAHGIDATVVRFAGLYGPGRYRIARTLDGPVTEGYLNLLHRADAAGVLAFVLGGVDATVVVAVDEEPVWRPAFAAWLAEACGVEPPPTETVAERLDRADSADPAGANGRVRASKRCSNRLLRSLGYAFACPTFREGYRDAVRTYRRTNG